MKTALGLKKAKYALREYNRAMKAIRENEVNFIICAAVVDRLKRHFKGCIVDDHEYTSSSLIGLHLVKGYNIARDFNIFLEQNEPILSLLGKTTEYTVKDNSDYQCMEYRWGCKLSIDVWYGSGDCKRIKIGETQKVVKETQYEVQCF